MKYILSLLFIISSFNLFAEKSLLDIEKELMNDYKRIIYWREVYINDSKLANEDSLDDVNINFKNKLLTFTSNTPQTLSYKFSGLKNLGVHICSSADGVFKIYSWDTKIKSGIHFIESIHQFKLNRKVFSELKIKEKESDAGYFTDEIFSIKVNQLITYIVYFKGINSDTTQTVCLKAFEIHDTGFKDDISFFKSKTSFDNEIKFEYDSRLLKINIDEIVFYDELKRLLFIPVINSKKQLTKKKNSFKFNGKYFEE
jgi:hypothetical protein